jgi:hypothetical protein
LTEVFVREREIGRHGTDSGVTRKPKRHSLEDEFDRHGFRAILRAAGPVSFKEHVKTGTRTIPWRSAWNPA